MREPCKSWCIPERGGVASRHRGPDCERGAAAEQVGGGGERSPLAPCSIRGEGIPLRPPAIPVRPATGEMLRIRPPSCSKGKAHWVTQNGPFRLVASISSISCSDEVPSGLLFQIPALLIRKSSLRSANSPNIASISGSSEEFVGRFRLGQLAK